MSRKSIALFLATTGLITSLAGCGGGQEANENGGDTPSGQMDSPAAKSKDQVNDNDDDGDKSRKHQGDQDHKDDEGGEGGEGGEG